MNLRQCVLINIHLYKQFDNGDNVLEFHEFENVIIHDALEKFVAEDGLEKFFKEKLDGSNDGLISKSKSKSKPI